MKPIVLCTLIVSIAAFLSVVAFSSNMAGGKQYAANAIMAKACAEAGGDFSVGFADRLSCTLPRGK